VNGREKVVAKNGPFSPMFYQIGASSWEEENHCAIHRGNRRRRPELAGWRGSRNGSDRILARAVRLTGVSRLATADGDQIQLKR
jgi:hypothetical protein